jgi:ankyrin repeat protein
MIDLLLRIGADVASADWRGQTPLHYAVERKKCAHPPPPTHAPPHPPRPPFSSFAAILQLLPAASNAALFARDGRAKTILHLWPYGHPNGTPPLLRVLERWREAIATPDADGLSPIHYAATSGAAAEMNALLKLPGFDANVRAISVAFGRRRVGPSPLQCAVIGRNVDAVAQLLAAAASLAVADGGGRSLLRLVCDVALDAPVECLSVVLREDLGAPDVLAQLARGGDVKNLGRLLKAAATIEFGGGGLKLEPLVVAAAAAGKCGVLNLLFESGGGGTAAFGAGSRALLAAAEGGWVDAAALLLESGAAVDSLNEEGYTPYLFAARGCNVPLMASPPPPAHKTNMFRNF